MPLKTNNGFLLLLTLFFSSVLLAQEDQIQKEIDRAVWKPFQRAFETLDAPTLNGIYGPEVIRVTPNGIDTKNVFKAANVERFKDYDKKGVTIGLDFWFDTRHSNVTTSYEVGFYRITATQKDGSFSHSYGQFHIVLKKLDGQWKIVQDWDTATINGVAITEADFAKKDPINF